MARGHAPWRRPDAKKEHDVRAPGPVRRLTEDEIAVLDPFNGSKIPHWDPSDAVLLGLDGKPLGRRPLPSAKVSTPRQALDRELANVPRKPPLRFGPRR